MILSDIGFYTLSENRCCHASSTSSIKRVEILLTGMCNFNCPYCRHKNIFEMDKKDFSKKYHQSGRTLEWRRK